jgi:hypothetical protein
MIRRGLAALLAVSVTTALLVPPAGAQGPNPGHRRPRVVGGVESAPGQWPWQVALIRARDPGTANPYCGGTVLNHSWVMTAAHCVLFGTGALSLPSDIDVLVGTNVLGDGSGQRFHVAAVRPNPDFDFATLRNDIALLQLSKPTNVQPIPVVTASQTALWAPGTVATVSGWGSISADVDNPVYPTHLRHATVPIQSDATCAQKYPPGRLDPTTGESLTFYAASMVCAGPLAGGRDTCVGDSGGPLMVPGPGGSGWVQVGITGWGFGCAQPNNPGVYSRLGTSSMAGFASRTKRFGPFNDDSSFITRQYLDFNNRRPSAAEVAAWRSRLNSRPARDLISALESSTTWQSHGWAVARLFRAFFLRDPDTGGLAYWIRRTYSGVPLRSVGSVFAGSAEFLHRYGALDDDAFVDLVYRNVLKRSPDSGGRAYWTRRLSAGVTRGSMMAAFSESHEYRVTTYSRVRAITTWYGLLRRVPSPAQTDLVQAEPIATLIDSLRSSFSYALRF